MGDSYEIGLYFLKPRDMESDVATFNNRTHKKKEKNDIAALLWIRNNVIRKDVNAQIFINETDCVSSYRLKPKKSYTIPIFWCSMKGSTSTFKVSFKTTPIKNGHVQPSVHDNYYVATNAINKASTQFVLCAQS